ncbi:alkyl/aryl-sulfatase [Pseudooceanicola marinus]|uniref:alkyl/aryl-sulfatase n=1 Tax=Pseudooceanicola marinus TaxID=396013 RepID=UPI001CD7C3C2|nr:alkyl sulfatase dimerization domain-containing protein [Pseudooceanicola marinus]MCA1338068.1 MBL fold metallo-hydrolase [Pseudooceanicola marinus]
MRNTDKATEFTRAAQQAAKDSPVFDWATRADFDAAERGLMLRPADPAILDDEGHIVWHHEAFETTLAEDAPDTAHPSLWRHAQLNNVRGLFKVTEGVYQVRGESQANITFVETENGYIAVDALTTVETARYALALMHKHVAEKPVLGVVITHTHSDHFGGIRGLVSEEDVKAGKVRIIATDDFVHWVIKEQGLAAEGMPARGDYMFGENLPVGATGLIDNGLGQAIEGGTVTFILPTDVVPKGGASFEVDGEVIECMYAPGEAPTGLHAYFPKRKTVHVADNAYMCMVNIYTIRGAFPRDASAWADTLDRSLRFDDAEIMVGGHNWPVFGRENMLKYLSQQRDAIKYLHDQTLRLMSHGYVGAEIANAITLPPELESNWALRPYYGSIKHNVRGIYAYYLGWYDGNPATLDPLPPRPQAKKTLEYMGGVDAVMEKAQADFDKGEYRWVASILDQVIWAEPDHAEAKELLAKTHSQLGYQTENATWRNAYLSAAQELRHGLPEGAKNHRNMRDVMKGMDAQDLIGAMSIRLNGPAAVGHDCVINWEVSDSGDACAIEISNSVLYTRAEPNPAADATVTLSRELLSQLALGEAGHDALLAGGAQISGKSEVVSQLFAMLDTFPLWFPISTHPKKAHEDEYLG